MNRNIICGKRNTKGGDLKKLWTGPAYDATGVDSDIEVLIGLLQQRHGYTRDEANAELVRKLSFAV